MTTKEMIEVMQAFIDGETIEVKYNDDPDSEYNITKLPDWDWERLVYRIKPKEKYRPYNCIEEFLQAQKEHGPYIRNLTLPAHYYLPAEVFFDINDDNDFTVVFTDRIDITNKTLANKEEWQWQDGTPCCKLI